jgi:tetratricopeptide (TPR) repeat protein
MNLKILSLPIFVLTFFACTSKSKNQEFAELLNNPPYNKISDSIKQFPKNDQLFINRAMLLTKQGQFDAANLDFEKAWQLKPTEDAAVFYAAGLINAHRIDSAILHLNKAIALFPENLVLKERLGYSYEQKKDFNNAIKTYDAILQKDNTDFRSWAAKGFCYQELNKDSAAIISFEKSYAIEPNQTVGIELASMYAETKNPKTIAFCDALIKADSAEVKNIQPYYCKGLYYLNTGNNSLAKTFFEKCIKEDYTFPYAYLDLSTVLFEEKKYMEAIKILEIAKKVDNRNAEPYYRLGKCLEALGNKEGAILEYERALALDGNYPVALEALQQLKNAE